MTLLENAEVIYLLGQLRSSPVVDLLRYILTMLGKRCVLLDPGGGLATFMARAIRNTDLLFAVSFRFYATEVVNIVDEAARRRFRSSRFRTARFRRLQKRPCLAGGACRRGRGLRKAVPGRRRWPIRGGNPMAAAPAATSGGRSATPGPLLPLAGTRWRRIVRACWPSTGGPATSKRRPPWRRSSPGIPAHLRAVLRRLRPPLLRARPWRPRWARSTATGGPGTALHRRPGPDGMRQRASPGSTTGGCPSRRISRSWPRSRPHRRVRQDMLEKNKTAGLARIDWLLTTIDWLTRYDAAAVVLCKGGKVDRLLAEAEAKRGDGDQAGARSWRSRPPAVEELRIRPCIADLSLENDHLRRMGRAGHDQRQGLRRLRTSGRRDQGPRRRPWPSRALCPRPASRGS